MKASQSSPVLRLHRLLAATQQEVFDAWTDPAGMKEWMCPEGMSVAEVQIEPTVGGRFRLVMHGEHGEFEHTGEYRDVQPPHRLAFTWRSPGTYGQETLVTVELLPRGAMTELILTHEWLPDTRAREQHAAGWQSLLEKFVVFLASSQDVHPPHSHE